MRALVVDDSRATRSIISKMLKEMGFQVFEAAHGREALDFLKRTGPTDVLLVDWNMPEMNGYDFLCAVRNTPAYEQVPLMMVTSETEVSQMAKALQAGANEYIMKPFTKEEMVLKLGLMGITT
jgi:two-component system chemotaxis response regulator CheY